jgi:hypothetical protein
MRKEKRNTVCFMFHASMENAVIWGCTFINLFGWKWFLHRNLMVFTEE